MPAGSGVAVWTPLLLPGAPAELIYWQFIAIMITGLVGHANVPFRIPAFAHRLLVTPQFHRIHHAADPRGGNSNFGVVFPFWDIAFRSHCDPLRVRFWDAGIRDDPIPRRFHRGAEVAVHLREAGGLQRARRAVAQPSMTLSAAADQPSTSQGVQGSTWRGKPEHPSRSAAKGSCDRQSVHANTAAIRGRGRAAPLRR
ncbi:MAG TPA: sterol desaturase family protein [Burkholderiaceae bacterium]|nr:sterol desaturase family protein [Burkholderiaceae bacterium]